MTRLSWLTIVLLLLASGLPACDDGSGGLDDDDAADDDDVTGDDDDTTAGDDDDDDDDDDDTTPGTVGIAALNPVNQATEVALGTSIYVDFDGATQGTIALADSAGTEITGTSLFVSPERLTFQADSALIAGEAYTASVNWTDGMQDWTFTTDAAGGTPLGLDPAGLTFAWDITTGNVVSPPAAAQFLTNATQVLLTEVVSTDANTTSLTLMGATADDSGVAQNLCQPTADIPAAGEDPALWLDPYFSAGPAEFSQTIAFDLQGFPVELDVVLHGVSFEGEFTSSNTTAIDAISNGTLYFWLDSRDIVLPIGDLCSGLALAGASCSACPNELSESQCVVVWVENMTAAVVPALDLVERTQEVIDQDSTNCP